MVLRQSDALRQVLGSDPVALGFTQFGPWDPSLAPAGSNP
jgi:hypothetical protein